MYNRYMITGSTYGLNEDVRSCEEDRLPASCIGCGACAEHCPQKIEIPSRMGDIDQAIKAL